MSNIPFVDELGDTLERTLASQVHSTSAPPWRRRTVRVGRLAIPWAVVPAFLVTATAAAAATIALSATSLFRSDPQGLNFNGDIETVLPSTVREIRTVSIPDYGQVRVWVARTKPGGFCFALKLPDGVWGGLDSAHPGPHGWAGGWAGGSVPGCFQTQQQQTLKLGAAYSDQALESWPSEIRNDAGQIYSIFVGYVEAQGTATTIRDPRNGVTAPVSRDGYYALVEKAPLTAAPLDPPGHSPEKVACGDCDENDLQVLNVADQELKPDYTSAGMLPGYKAGPSQP